MMHIFKKNFPEHYLNCSHVLFTFIEVLPVVLIENIGKTYFSNTCLQKFPCCVYKVVFPLSKWGEGNTCFLKTRVKFTVTLNQFFQNITTNSPIRNSLCDSCTLFLEKPLTSEIKKISRTNKSCGLRLLI